MDEVRRLVGRADHRRALVQVAAGAPASDFDRLARARDVVDVEAERVRRERELGRSLGGVDPGVPASRGEPDLVRAARERADEREPARMRGRRHVVEPEAAEAARAGLEARDREHAVEARRLDPPHDRLLGPGVLERGKGRDVPGASRVRQVVDPHALRGAVGPASAAGEVGEVPLAHHVAAVAAFRLDVGQHLEPRRSAEASVGR